MPRDSLKAYRAKRRFHRTPEPKGGRARPSRRPRFVIQKHDARNLHYDFRLEVQGVLKSWAVPRTVLVWDTGTFRNFTEKDGKAVPMARALRRGHAVVWLRGKKLVGGFALTRIGSGRRRRWLLVKMADEEADARRNPVRSDPDSVLTGRSLKEIAAEER